MYLTYDDWTTMGGEIIDMPMYTRLEYQAQRKIDEYTFGRLVNIECVPECVKMAMFELIEILYTDKTEQSVQSMSNDGLSVTLTAQQPIETRICNLIHEYLTPELLYCGV